MARLQRVLASITFNAGAVSLNCVFGNQRATYRMNSWQCYDLDVLQIIVFWVHKGCVSLGLWASGSGGRIHSLTESRSQTDPELATRSHMMSLYTHVRL